MRSETLTSSLTLTPAPMTPRLKGSCPGVIVVTHVHVFVYANMYIQISVECQVSGFRFRCQLQLELIPIRRAVIRPNIVL